MIGLCQSDHSSCLDYGHHLYTVSAQSHSFPDPSTEPIHLPLRNCSLVAVMSDIEKQVTQLRDELKSDSQRIRDSTATYPSSAPVESIDGHTEESSSSEIRNDSTKAYLTIFGAFLALFCTFGQMNAFGTFQAWYTTHQLNTLDASTISWIGSLQLWVFFFSVR